MHKKDLLDYNLSQISNLDKKMSDLRKEKSKYIEKNERKDNLYDLFSKMQERIFLTVLIISISLIIYNEVENAILAIALTAGIIVVFNLIIIGILKIFEPDHDFSQRLLEYNESLNELLHKRNSYISLYRYTMYGDRALYDNIKSKIYKGKSYEYDEINKLNYEEDSYEYVTLNEMKDKENNLVRLIRDKVALSLKLQMNDENLSKEQLNMIQNAL